ncbi:MAG: redoxin domain-containing protein [Zoogloeaceae bacterium]|nr:redoxin domain-containing protein [Zoogloeaceae bacterium]
MPSRSLLSLFRLAAFTLAAAFTCSVFAAPAIGQPAPAFTAVTADGKTLSLDSLKGKTVILEWTNHDCPFVGKHYGSGNMQALQKDAAAKGYVWLQVISSAPGKQGHVDGPAAIKLNASRNAAPSNTLLDPEGKIGKLYGAQTTPHMYLIDANGVLIYKGGIDSLATTDKADIAKAEPYFANALATHAAGRKINPDNTKPYGCSVKYE